MMHQYCCSVETDGEKDMEASLIQFHEETTVTFGELTDDVIQGYINTGEPM